MADPRIDLGAELYKRGGLKALRGPLFDPLIARVEAAEREREADLNARRAALTPPGPLRLVLGGRKSGKTTALLDWVRAGYRTPGEPGWSRVVLCGDLAGWQHLTACLRDDRDMWDMWDGPRCRAVFTIEQWQRSRGLDPLVEVAIDNAEQVLAKAVGGHRLVAATMEAEGFALDTDAPET